MPEIVAAAAKPIEIKPEPINDDDLLLLLRASPTLELVAEGLARVLEYLAGEDEKEYLVRTMQEDGLHEHRVYGRSQKSAELKVLSDAPAGALISRDASTESIAMEAITTPGSLVMPAPVIEEEPAVETEAIQPESSDSNANETTESKEELGAEAAGPEVVGTDTDTTAEIKEEPIEESTGPNVNNM